MTTLRFEPGRCTGCGRCVEVCPHGVFAMELGRARVADRDGCMECGACRNNCAADAIEVQPGVGCAMALVSAIVARRSSGGDCRCR